MTENQFNKKRIAILPWPNKPNCFLCLSGAMRSKTNYGDKWYAKVHDEQIQKFTNSDVCEARITFAYRSEKIACEWDGEHGAIQLWFKCDENYKEGYDEARPHWLFDYAYGSGYWSQMAVDENHLVESFNQGDYDHIFSVLKRFVVSRETE